MVVSRLFFKVVLDVECCGFWLFLLVLFSFFRRFYRVFLSGTNDVYFKRGFFRFRRVFVAVVRVLIFRLVLVFSGRFFRRFGSNLVFCLVRGGGGVLL